MESKQKNKIKGLVLLAMLLSSTACASTTNYCVTASDDGVELTEVDSTVECEATTT